MDMTTNMFALCICVIMSTLVHEFFCMSICFYVAMSVFDVSVWVLVCHCERVCDFAVQTEHWVKIKENKKIEGDSVISCSWYKRIVPYDLEKRLGELDNKGRTQTFQTKALLKIG